MLAALLLPLTPGVAAAHGEVAGPPPTSLPVLRAVEPAVPGLAVTVIEGGARLRLDNGTDAAVGVPAGPVVSPGTSAAWTDPALAGDAPAWEVRLLVGDEPVIVRGERVWPGDPPAPPWWALTVAAALGTFYLGASAASQRAAVAAVTVAVLTAHALHVLGAALVLAEPPSFGSLAGAAGIGVAGWAFGLAGVLLTVAGRPIGLSACAAAGGVTAMLTAFDTVGFHRAVLVSGWAFDLDRATTVIAFGGGVGLVLTGWAALREPPAAASTP